MLHMNERVYILILEKKPNYFKLGMISVVLNVC